MGSFGINRHFGAASYGSRPDVCSIPARLRSLVEQYLAQSDVSAATSGGDA